MDDEHREGGDRRNVQRGGRRASDLRSLPPELRDEAAEYTAEIARCVDVLYQALEDDDVVTARQASQTLKRAAERLHIVLTTGKTMRGL